MENKNQEQINTNLEFWNNYKKVPSNAMKAFDNGKFKGTDINTMWRLKVLTESFGMCGFGWYYTLKRTWIETTQNNEQFAFAEIELFIKQNGEWSMPIIGTGGNKLTRLTKDGNYSTSDEAFKMAITDAIGVACRNLGIGADVYWENDKTKYTEDDKINKQENEVKNRNLPESITEDQIAEIKALGVIIENVLINFNVPSLNELSYNQAQMVINKKKQMMGNK